MRRVIHSISRDAGIDHAQLVRQARSMKRIIRDDVRNERFGFFDLPKIDAKAELDHPLVDSEFIPQLENLFLGPSHFFALNAAYVLYSLREHPDYPNVLVRLLTGGRGESLRLSAALVCHLPDGIGQQYLLDRLIHGESTPGCRHLYESLKGPYGVQHVEAVRKGLSGNSALAAKAAAELVKEFPLDADLIGELRAFFDQWRTKEKPYPKEGGTVPESPRDQLAKILAPAFASDHEFLLELLADDRPDVRGSAREHAFAEAVHSDLLRLRLLEGVQNNQLEPGLLRAAVSKGLYSGEEAITVARLLHSEDARLRYAALPILDVMYLQPDQVRNESNRLLTDKELDIREGASWALGCLESSSSESKKP